MNGWTVALWVFLLGGFGAAGKWYQEVAAAYHQRKMDRLDAENRRRLELEAANRPPEPICGCTHHLAQHGADGCHEMVRTATVWDAKRKPVSYEIRRCTCQQYIGPEPLGTIYAPEIAS